MDFSTDDGSYQLDPVYMDLADFDPLYTVNSKAWNFGQRFDSDELFGKSVTTCKFAFGVIVVCFNLYNFCVSVCLSLLCVLIMIDAVACYSLSASSAERRRQAAAPLVDAPAAHGISWLVGHFCHFLIYYHVVPLLCLQCFDAVGWVAGRASGL